jgi:hypothetical protein
MTRPVITALPAAPTRGEDAATFAAKANTFVAALPAYGTESNAVAAFVEDEADAAELAKVDAEIAQAAAEQAAIDATTNGAAQVDLAAAQVALAGDQVDLAALEADRAELAADAAEAASNAEEWTSGETYEAGDVVWSPITFLSYRANTTTSGTTDPSASADWTALIPDASVNAAVFTKTDTATTTSSSYADTGLEVTITLNDPAASVLLQANVQGTAVSADGVLAFFRGATQLTVADAAGARSLGAFSLNIPGSNLTTLSSSGSLLDTPGSAGPHTYKLRWKTEGTAYLNRSTGDGDLANRNRGISTLSAIEVAP